MSLHLPREVAGGILVDRRYIDAVETLYRAAGGVSDGGSAEETARLAQALEVHVAGGGQIALAGQDGQPLAEIDFRPVGGVEVGDGQPTLALDAVAYYLPTGTKKG